MLLMIILYLSSVLWYSSGNMIRNYFDSGVNMRAVYNEIVKNNVKREARTLSKYACKSNKGFVVIQHEKR